jgi:hypothetical protein
LYADVDGLGKTKAGMGDFDFMQLAISRCLFTKIFQIFRLR